MSELKNIWSHSACLSQSQLLQYLDNKLEREESYLVEAHLADCDFCSDAFDGWHALATGERYKLLEELKNESVVKLEEHMALVNTGTIELQAHKGGKKRNYWGAVAGLLLFILGGGAVVYSFYYNQQSLVQHDSVVIKTDKEEGIKSAISSSSPELTTLTVDDSAMPLKSRETEIIAKNDRNPQVAPTVPPAGYPVFQQQAEQALASLPDADLSKRIKGNESEKLKDVKTSDRGNALRESEIAHAPPVIAKAENALSEDVGTMNTATQPAFKGKMEELNKELSPSKKRTESKVVAVGSGRTSTALSDAKEQSIDEEMTTLNHYDRAMDYYQSKDFKNSIRYFKKALRDKKGDNLEDIKYYMALAYQKLGNQKEAMALFEELSTGSKYKNAAKKALEAPTK